MAVKKPGFAEQNRAKFLQQQKAARDAGFVRSALSLRPGGQPINKAGIQQNTKNIAGELSGLYEGKRAIKNFKAGANIAQQKGLGAYADSDYWKKMAAGTAQAAVSIPFAGALAKGGVRGATKFFGAVTGATARKKAAEAAAKAAADKAAKAAAARAEKAAAKQLEKKGYSRNEYGQLVDKFGQRVDDVVKQPRKPPAKLPPIKPPTNLNNARAGLNALPKKILNLPGVKKTLMYGVPALGAAATGLAFALTPKESWEQGYVPPVADNAGMSLTDRVLSLGVAPKPVITQEKPTTFKVQSPELQYVPEKQAPVNQQPPVNQQTPTTGGIGGVVTDSQNAARLAAEEAARLAAEQNRINNQQPDIGISGGGVLQGPYIGPEGGGGVLNLPYTGPVGGYGVRNADISSQPLFQTGVTFNPSALAAGESGPIGAASIASQMANTAPASTFIGNALGEATGMPTTTAPKGILGAAQVEGARYLADLASQAQSAAAADAATRELYSQNVMGVRGGAADILGGRAPAILGQGVTGARRSYATGQVANTLSNISEQEALRRTYGSSLLKAYEKEAKQVLTATQERARAAAQIRGQGVA